MDKITFIPTPFDFESNPDGKFGNPYQLSTQGQYQEIYKNGHFSTVPNIPGVYIVGIKKMEKENEHFVPLYVGETNDLRKRIIQHWMCNLANGYLNSHKELFDLSASIVEIYDAIKIWNDKWHEHKNSSKLKHDLYNEIAFKGNNSLIWFNCRSFFDYYLSIPVGQSQYIDGRGHLFSLATDFSNLKLRWKQADSLEQKIVTTKNIITNNFLFAYWIDEKDDKIKREEIEANTKYELELKGKYTYANVLQNPIGKKIWKQLKQNSASITYDIDLSQLRF